MLAHREWTLSELAEVQAVSLPTMSSTITTLEERAWVTRERSPEDRRVVLVQLTSQGRAVIEDAHHHAEEQIAVMLAPLAEDERERLQQGLEILRKVFEAGLSEADRHKP
jgi:MarR family 2-MHQ and catechol resistance regulon transcriptional repressor